MPLYELNRVVGVLRSDFLNATVREGGLSVQFRLSDHDSEFSAAVDEVCRSDSVRVP